MCQKGERRIKVANTRKRGKGKGKGGVSMDGEGERCFKRVKGEEQWANRENKRPKGGKVKRVSVGRER